MDCKSLKKRGLIPGPEETEDEFKERVRMLKGSHESEHARSLAVVEGLFGCLPNWIPIEYGNAGLSLWEGAATWVEKGKVRIQLKNGFKKGVYLWIYRRDEVLAHELTHLCRMAYNEPKYEEIFAYLTSKSKLRRLFGGLFRRPLESSLFVVLAFMPLLALMFEKEKLFTFLWSLPLVYFSFLTVRLTFAQRTLNRCVKVLRHLVKEPLGLAFQLTDREIGQFARSTPEETKEYILKEPSFRWRFIRESVEII